MNWDIENMRKDYAEELLDVGDVATNPIQQFNQWFEAAVQANLPEPNAMTLATCDKKGRPSARIVLLKGIDDKGFRFYTNYNSRKGQEMLDNPHVALVFNWLGLQRQIRIEGIVEKLTPAQSTEYFQSRPKGSQIGAWTSPQSDIIPNRQVLEIRVEELKKKYEGQETLPRPDHWGGYVVQPDRVEFWQGRASRLHDRIQYMKVNNEWQITRLAP